METVGDLNRLWRASGSGAGVFCPAVAAHMRDLRMGGDRRGSRFSLPVWQKINDLVSIEVHHDGAKRSAAPKGEIVDAQAFHVFYGLGGQRHDPSHHRHKGTS